MIRCGAMGHEEHKSKAKQSIGCVVVTASDTRDEATDGSGKLIQELLTAAGHTVAGYRILKDEPAQIAAFVRDQLGKHEVQAVIVNGGTGVSERDSTFEALDGLLEKRLPGFGELFRMLSYQEIGSSAMLSRATCGVTKGTLIFSVPGSTAAVRLAMEKLILPELGHLVFIARPSAGHGEKHGKHAHKH
jgi:molybdenum cofactor biosynthesis protein B